MSSTAKRYFVYLFYFKYYYCHNDILLINNFLNIFYFKTSLYFCVRFQNKNYKCLLKINKQTNEITRGFK